MLVLILRNDTAVESQDVKRGRSFLRIRLFAPRNAASRTRKIYFELYFPVYTTFFANPGEDGRGTAEAEGLLPEETRYRRGIRRGTSKTL